VYHIVGISALAARAIRSHKKTTLFVVANSRGVEAGALGSGLSDS